MPKLQRAALVITLALLSTSPSFAQRESIPASDRALAIVDASSLQESHMVLSLALAGDRFVLKDVRVIMQDTRYIEGWLSRKENNIPGRISRYGQLLRAPTKDFEDLTLLEQIRSNCSVIGMRDKSRIAAILQSDADAPMYGLFGEKMVNVLRVNLELRKRFGAPTG